MGFAKPIEQIFIKLSRYIYVSKRYYTRRKTNEKYIDSTGGLGGVATKYLLFSLGKSVMDICHEKIIVEQYAAMI